MFYIFRWQTICNTIPCYTARYIEIRMYCMYAIWLNSPGHQKKSLICRTAHIISFSCNDFLTNSIDWVPNKEHYFARFRTTLNFPLRQRFSNKCCRKCKIQYIIQVIMHWHILTWRISTRSHWRSNILFVQTDFLVTNVFNIYNWVTMT